MRRPDSVFEMSFDFETTTPNWNKIIDNQSKINPQQQVIEHYKTHDKPKVYAWAVAVDKDLHHHRGSRRWRDIKKVSEPTRELYYGQDIESFLDFALTQDRNYTFVAHNGAKFDTRFILPQLKGFGFKQFVKIKQGDVEDPKRREALDTYYKKPVGYNWPLPFEYQAVIERGKKIYTLIVFLPPKDCKQGKKGGLRRITFIDNLLLFNNTSVENLGKEVYNVKIANGVSEVEASQYLKSKIDYTKVEPFKDLNELETYQDGKFLDYLLRDVRIVHEYRNVMNDTLDPYGFPRETWKMTSGATAYAGWEKSYGEILFKRFNYLIRRIPKGEKGELFKFRCGKPVGKDQLYRKLIDYQLPTKWMLKENENGLIFNQLYDAYLGGITKVNEQYRGQLTSDVWWFDIVSSYPTIMASDLPCPIGEQVRECEGDFHLYKIRIINELTNEKGMPFISETEIEDINEFGDDDNLYDDEVHGGTATTYLQTLEVGVETLLLTPEFERFTKYYTHNGEMPIEGKDYVKQTLFSWKTVPMKEIFGKHINNWFKLKERASKEKNSMLKTFAKLQMNSLYGKMGTKRDREGFIYQDQEYVKVEEVSDNIKYLPIAMAITSYGRCALIDACGYDENLRVYGDSDSMVVKRELRDKIIKDQRFNIGSGLGNWECENEHPHTIIVRRPKQYMSICSVGGRECQGCSNPYKIKYAGIRFSDEDLKTLTFSDYIKGKVIYNQLTPYLFEESGVILFPTRKRIKPIWDYEPQKEQIYCDESDFLPLLDEETKEPK